MDKQQKTPFWATMTLISLLLVVISIFPIVFGADHGLKFLLFSIIILIVSFIGFYIVTSIDVKQKNALKAEADENEFKQAFYDKCKQFNISSITTPEELEKAKTIAASLNCPEKAMANLGAYLEQIKTEIKSRDDAAHQAMLFERRQEERELHKQLTLFANYTGKEKRIAMLEAERSAFKLKADACRNLTDSALSYGQQKEINWALEGGIASGLAGGAAGVAAAVDAQIKNAEIRANNKAAREEAMPLILQYETQARKHDETIRLYEDHIAQTKTKILNSTSKEDILKKIHFGNPQIETSETGAISIKVYANVTEEILILDSTPGVIDGTLLAEFYDSETFVGTAELVLPLWGLRGGALLEGLCLASTKHRTNYRVEYKAKHLWEMEA